MTRLGKHPRRPDHPALIGDDGAVLQTWAADQTREEIAALLAKGGFALHADDTVTKAGGL